MADAPKQNRSPGDAMTFHGSREKFQKAYAAGRDAYHEAQDDRRAHTAMVYSKLLDLYERVFREWPSLARRLERRNRPTTLFGNNDQDVL